ncbi:MAG: NADP-dependent malic enzyme [Bacteroidetes bacterium]|nr:MAG: NADP-dependent malic enzyme [Bacteroidota bacterium]PTM14172.1 MAG: NADP-dependent malic enzyme [Bacteroidota bacterium]
MDIKEEALHYHAKGRPGKIEVIPTKETANQRDLSLAYSPGVAEPCLAIEKNVEDVYKYTAKGNLVAVISNGTAVLGLGDIGPEASKPVMEGKGLLFKIYADIDCFDLELNTKNVDEFVRTVKLLEPTFGGVNLEDISAPECFEIEERLKAELNIPVMHDDQHGTAIISGAALLNALEIVGKEMATAKIVVNGAGASAISCTRIYVSLGARKENIFMYDSKGLIHPDRDNLDGKKAEFVNGSRALDTSLTDILVGADVFIGLSRGNVLNKDMIKGMAPDPVIFAMANPTPEISYEDATSARPDCIMATGRSDYPNQVNNVLGFPFIFRGALDVRASEINEEMKLGAVRALADLAKKPVPEIVTLAYGNTNLTFGRDYIIPKPVDPRLITTVAPAVAKAAMDSGVAKFPITDWEAYKLELAKRLGHDNTLSKVIETKAKQAIKRVVFADAENVSVLKAAQVVTEERIAEPVLLGNRETIMAMLTEHNIQLSETIEIIDPKQPANPQEKALLEKYTDLFYQKRQRKGLIRSEAAEAMTHKNYYGAMMVETGAVDAMISGLSLKYPHTVRPALQIVGPRKGLKKVASTHILMTRFGPLFLADTTINHFLNAEDIANITELVAEQVEMFNIVPKIALVTYSNFGTVPNGESAVMMREATAILHQRHPDWMVDGEMQAHMALDPELRQQFYPFSKLGAERANTLIFPNLSSANIAYNLLGEATKMDIIGPVLLGMKKPIHVLQLGATVRQIVDMVGIAAIHAQLVDGKKR